MNNTVKRFAKDFFKKYKLLQINLNGIKDVLSKQGYTIIEYNNIYNSEDIANIIEKLNLSDYVQHSKGFTYTDDNMRIVFLNEDLSEDEKLLVLAHEEGHIFCGHFGKPPIIGKDVHDEYEANEFAHYILNDNYFRMCNAFFKQHKKICLFALSIALIAVIGIVGVSLYHQESKYYGEYYVTSTGTKYHEKGCIFVKDKTNVRRLTKEEFESGKYEPCEICLP